MEGKWKHWIGKKVFLILKNNRQYSGRIIEVDETAPPIVFITILDKFGNKVMFVQGEIEIIQEE